MKISVICDSLLLEESLKIFLKLHLVNYKQSDFVISDKHISSDKPLFIISTNKNANLTIPFTTSKLLLSLQDFYQTIKHEIRHDTLEEQIDSLLKEYTSKLLTLVKNNI